MLRAIVRETLGEQYGELLFLDPEQIYDHCIVGVAYRCGMDPVLIYDREAVINSLIADGMDPCDAEEFFEFNTAGAYVGPMTPMYLDRVGDGLLTQDRALLAQCLEALEEIDYADTDKAKALVGRAINALRDRLDQRYTETIEEPEVE